MGVRGWQFSTEEQTILNASAAGPLALLPGMAQSGAKGLRRSRSASRSEKSAEAGGNRLILLMMPQVLPLERAKVWERWQGVGRPVRLDLAMSRETQSARKRF